jgi:hypothetical protein
MTTYELTTGTREDFNNVQTRLINDFISQIIGAEVTADWRNPRTGRIVSCYNPCNTFESIVASVYFGDTDETKSYGIVASVSCGYMLFVDESLVVLFNEFKEANENIKHQWFEATQEAQRRHKEEQKLEQKRKANEKKMEGLKVSAEKEFSNLSNDSGKQITETDEFYWTLGWLAKHVGTLTAKMPDFLEASFVKHFGDVEHTTVDSTKVGPAGYTSQWRLSMEASLVKAKEIPATLTQYLNPTGKKLSKTSFIWKLVEDYGFKFGKKQDILDIMRCVPIQYVPIFNEGLKA